MQLRLIEQKWKPQSLSLVSGMVSKAWVMRLLTIRSGIGSMGYGMASNIRKKSPSSVTVYIVEPSTDATKRFVEEFSSYGPVEIAGTAREAASKALTVISMVPNPADARKVHLDRENGTIAAPADSRRLVLDSSTIDPSTTRTIGAELMAGEACKYIDTPVAVSSLEPFRISPANLQGRRHPCRNRRTDFHGWP